MSIPLAAKEMQIKPTMRYYTPRAKIKKKVITKIGEDMEKLEFS